MMSVKEYDPLLVQDDFNQPIRGPPNRNFMLKISLQDRVSNKMIKAQLLEQFFSRTAKNQNP